MAEILTPPIPTGPIIPQEYQDQIDQANRRRQIAQMLQQMSMSNKGPQQIGPVAAKISPLASLANIASAGVGGYLDANAASDASAAKTKFETDQSGDLAKLYATPEAQQAQFGAQSKFPQVQAIARTLQAQAEHRREEGAKIIGGAGGTNEALSYLNTGSQGPAIARPQPFVSTQPDPNDPSGLRKIPFITNFDKYGRPTMSVGSAATQTVNLPNTEAIEAKKSEQANLDKARTDAQAAQANLATNEQIVNTLQQGASTGGLAGYKQSLKQVGLGLGIPASEFPETGPTAVAKQLFGRALAEHAKTFGSQPTETEDKRISELVGTIDTDPSAIPQILAMTGGKAIKQLQDFQSMLATKRAGPAAAAHPGLFDTADIGIKMPEALNGPMPYQMQVVQALKQYGGDITKLKGPDGKPFDANSTFEIRPTPITPKGSAFETPSAATPSAPVAGTAANPLTIDQLSPAQKDALRKLLGQP